MVQRRGWEIRRISQPVDQTVPNPERAAFGCASVLRARGKVVEFTAEDIKTCRSKLADEPSTKMANPGSVCKQPWAKKKKKKKKTVLRGGFWNQHKHHPAAGASKSRDPPKNRPPKLTDRL